MTSSHSRPGRLLKPWPWAFAAVTILSGIFVWIVGHRGVFLLDQSILFDGAWRVVQGQAQYRDFISTFPPVPFALQALFFRLMGVDFSAMVLAGAVVNAVATLAAMLLVRHLMPDQPGIALITGLLTAVWFQAPFGTLWFEQTAFCFSLVALFLLVKCLGASDSAATRYRVGAGLLLGLALLSKQNAGAEFLPVAFGAAVIPTLDRKQKALRSVLEVIAGMLIVATLFLLWLGLFSSLSGFWKYYVVMARQIGSDRSGLAGMILAFFPLSTTLPWVLFAMVIFAAAFSKSRTASMSANRRALIVWTVVGCALYQNLFKLHTDNEIENSLPFLGLIYGLSFAVFWKYVVLAETGKQEWIKRAFFVMVGCLVLGFPFHRGLICDWSRSVQQFEASAVFDQHVQVPGMSRVVWGEPTHYGAQSIIDRRDFEAVNAWLAETQANFFVFPDSTMLYGLQRRVSPQPWLYFSPGHSFLKKELPQVDAAVVDSLKKNNVRAIVLEKDSWVGNQNLWKQMPKLKAWIEGDFEKVKDFGIYEVRLSKEVLQSRSR
jgi:Dolichyl-phosphate-mannose-protein mannosyltransferase